MNTFTCTAPGSLMLMGEHAVLYGRTALAAAIHQRITVSIRLRDDDEIHIHSETLGDFKTTLSELKPQKPFEFVLTAIQHSAIQRGIDITIHSDFSHQMGLGSSAAVTVAAVAALSQASGEPRLDLYGVFTRALAVVHAVQKQGSGADVAASTYGGIVEYNCAELPSIAKLIFAPDITVVFCGYKKPTVEVIQEVRARYEKNSGHYESIFTMMDVLVHKASNAIQVQDWETLGQLCNEQQNLMQDLGVSDDHLENLIAQLRAQPGILGAKISGSGLGDCVIGIGRGTHPAQIHTSISPDGLCYE